jgi:CubicO group peptidase (beta-lactamase class C family)
MTLSTGVTGLNVELTLRQSAQQVVIQDAAAPLLETTTTEISHTISQETLKDLPQTGGIPDWQSFLTFLPGTRGNGTNNNSPGMGPMPKDAIFALASMTKPMVAVATLMLAEQGDLLLNDTVGNYLPELKDMKVATASGIEPAHRQPTLQDMLRHTAGVSYGNRGDTPLHSLYESKLKSAANQSGAEFLQELGKLPLHYQPGTEWEYSHGLDVAGLAVEAVTKKRLGEFLQERLFGPSGMVDTGFTVPAPKAARIAKPLPVDPETGRPAVFRVPVTPWQYDCGGGCASGTALDYLRFAQMLLNKGTVDGRRLLSRKTVEYMTANQLGANVDVSRLHEFAVEHMDGFGFGLGVAVRTQPGVARVPGTPGEFLWSGAQGTFWVDPKEEMAVVFLANTPGPARRHYRELVKTLVVQAIAD